MKIKGRGLLVLALLVFGGYAFYDYTKDKRDDEHKLEASRFLTVNFEQVDSIELKKGEQIISLKKTVDGWNMESPLKDAADDSAAEDLVKMAATEKILDVAKEGPGIDWSIFGLDKPAGQITFINAAGKKDLFVIGSKTNFENNPFAHRNDEDRVIVINNSWLTRVEKPVVEFRDRRFLRHKMAAIDRFKLKNAKGLTEIALQEGRWVGLSKKDIILDQQKVRELLRGIANAKASNYVDGKLPSLKSLFTLDLKLDQKSWTAEVGQAADKKIYAKVSDPKFQLEMEPGALDNLINLKIDDLQEATAPKGPQHSGGEQQSAQIVPHSAEGGVYADKKDK